MMEKRDLKADLELCNKATPGPWRHDEWNLDCSEVYAPEVDNPIILVGHDPYDADFIVQAREGWPHAIERAIKAETEVEQLKGEIEQLLEIAFAHIPDVMRRHGYYVDANPEEDSEE